MEDVNQIVYISGLSWYLTQNILIQTSDSSSSQQPNMSNLQLPCGSDQDSWEISAAMLIFPEVLFLTRKSRNNQNAIKDCSHDGTLCSSQDGRMVVENHKDELRTNVEQKRQCSIIFTMLKGKRTSQPYLGIQTVVVL